MTLDLGLFKRQRFISPSITSFGGNFITNEGLSTGTQYAVHVFTSSGVFTLPAYVSTVTAQVLVVGGGGGGGGNNGGAGGGAGGLINSSTYILSPGFPYVITIGSGGTIGVSAGIPGGSGENSSIYNSDLSNSGYFGGSSYLQLGTAASTAVNALATQKYVTIESWLNTQSIQYVDGDPYWSSVNFLIDADTGSLVDRKGTYSLSAIGTTAVNTSIKKFGAGSIKLLGGGTVASLQITASNFTIPGAFTLDGWVYLTAGGRHALLGTPNGMAYSTDFGFGIFDIVSGYGAATNKGLCFMQSPTSGYGGNFLYTGQYPTVNTWTHFAIQRDASNNWSIYMNGVKGTLQNDNANAHAYTQMPANNGPAGSFNVYGLIGNWDGFATGGDGSSFAAGFNGYLDDFRLTIGVARYSGNAFTLPTASAYTLSQNTYFDDNGIFGQAPASGNSRYAIKLQGNYDQKIVFLWSDSGSTTQQVVTTRTLTQKTWNHIAITLDMTNPSSTTIKIYINGIAETFTGNNLSTHTVDNGNPSYIGGIYNSTAYKFNGYLSNFRFSKGSLLTYTDIFAPPTSKLTAPQIVLPYGISFNGTGDYLTAPSNAAFQLGTASYTFETWIYPTALGVLNTNHIINIGTYITGLMIRVYGTTTGLEIYTNNTQRLATSTGLTANTWQHIALVRNVSACTLYINGVVNGTFTDSSSISPATATLIIGMAAHNSSEFFTGYMSNYRLVKGVAVYTGTFTPPTTTLTTTQSAGTNIAAISTASYVALLTAQSNTIVDNSTYAQTLTPTGSPAVVSTLTLYSTTLLTLNDVTFIDKSVNNYPLTLSPTPPTISTSYIFTLVAVGGGGAGSGDSSGINYIGGNGGSGGGGATTGGTVGAGGTGIAGLGFAGGRGATNNSTFRSGGGGGGAGSTGTAAVSSTVAGSGGTGTFTTMLSTTTAIICKVGQYVTATNAIYFAGGGAGGPWSGSSSIAGLGGGGLQKASGTINTGGGGGGAGSAGTVGSGGSGVVIIRYPVPSGISAIDNTPTDPYFKNTSLLLTGGSTTVNNNNVFVDSSANTLTITAAVGTPTQGTFTPFDRNWIFSTLLGYGTYGYQTLPANIQYDISGADFTIEFWANFITWNTMGYSGMQLFTTFVQGSGWAIGWNGGVGSNMYFQTILNGVTQTSIDTTGIMPGTNFQLGTWNHFTVMQKTGQICFYLNGIMTYTAAAPIVAGTGDTLAIGVYQQNFDYAGNPNFYLSNTRIVKGTAVYSTTGFTPPTAQLTAISGTVLLMHQSSSSVDNSPLNSPVTNIVSGSAAQHSIHRFSLSTQGSAMGYAYNSIINSGSAYFDGSSRLNVPSSTAYSFGASANFTVESWVYWPAAAAGNQTIIEFNGSTRMIIGRTSTGFRLSAPVGGTDRSFTYNFTTLGTWYHWAVVRNSGFISVYINGVLANTPFSNTTAWSHTVANIGRNFDNAEPMTGYVANLRVVKDVAVYTTNFTLSNAPELLIQIPQSVTFLAPPTVTAYAWGGGGGGGQVGGWSYGAAAGAGGAAEGIIAVTSNTTYYVTVGGAGQVSPSSGVYAVGGGGSMLPTADNRYGGGGGGYSAIFNSASASQGTTILMAGGGGGGGSGRQGTGNVGGAGGGTTGQAGTSAYNGYTAYAGVAGGQTVATAGTGGTAGTALQGGTPGQDSYGGAGGGGYWGGGGGGYIEDSTMAGGGGGSGYFNASVVTSAVLTAGSGVTPGNSASALRGTAGVGGAVATAGSSGTVVLVYPATYSEITTTGSPTVVVSGGNRTYTWISSGTFTISLPGGRPTILSTQTSLLLNSSNIGIIDSTMKNNVTTVGAASLSSAVVKYNSRSIYFNISTSYLLMPVNSANSQFNRNNFTVEAWIYPTVAQATTIVSSNYSYSTAAGNWAFYTTVGSANLLYFNGGSSSTSGANHASSVTTTIPLNRWTHIAYSKISSVGYFFVNGLQIGAGVADTTGYSSVTGTLYIGRQANGQGFLTGYIDDLRITNGVARYTKNFIPPTSSPKLK